MRNNSARTHFLTGRLRVQLHAIRAEGIESGLGRLHLLFNSCQAPGLAEFGFKLFQGLVWTRTRVYSFQLNMRWKASDNWLKALPHSAGFWAVVIHIQSGHQIGDFGQLLEHGIFKGFLVFLCLRWLREFVDKVTWSKYFIQNESHKTSEKLTLHIICQYRSILWNHSLKATNQEDSNLN